MSSSQSELLKSIYYNPSKGLRGIQALYYAAKKEDPTVRLSDVKDFIKKQELHQVVTTTKIKYYPLASPSPFARLQMDLLDVRNEIPRMNNRTTFIMCLIDVYSRYGFIRLLKSKNESDVLNAFRSIIDEIKSTWDITPSQIDCDNESSFISTSFTNYCKSKGIWLNFSLVGDFRSKGIVERWNRTLRELIARYRTAYKTNRYVDVINQMIEGYNQSYHSFLGVSPMEAIENPIYRDLAYQKKLDKATTYEPLKIGDKVRLMIKHKTFDKQSSTVKWSVNTHKVEQTKGNIYYVTNRRNPYKRSELKKIDIVEVNPDVQSSFLRDLQGRRIQDTEGNLRRHREAQTIQRRMSRELR